MTWWHRRTQTLNGRIYRPSGYNLDNQPLLPIWGILAAMATVVAVILMNSGCSVYRSDKFTIVDVGTGNRGFSVTKTGEAVYWHGDIPETITATVPLAEAVAKGAAQGAVKGVKGGL